MSNFIHERNALYRRALWLGYVTVFYNVAEGLVSILLGYSDDTLALFGFGVDSIIEVISGLGIIQMVRRISRNPDQPITPFEVRALKVTGVSFFALAAGLTAGIVLTLVTGRVPESTFWGTVISGLSLSMMGLLYFAKMQTGKRLHSAPLISDAKCTLVCIYMSVVLLLSSLIFELTGFVYADAIGAAGLVWFSLREGAEAMEKARKRSQVCGCEGKCGG